MEPAMMVQDHSAKGYIRNYFANMKQMLKRPRIVMISLLLTVLVSEVQFLLSMMSAAGKGGNGTALASFALYANGGMYGGVAGAIGGFFGKMLLMMFLNAFVLGIETHQNPFANFGAGFVKTFRAFAFKRLFDPAALILGASFSLIIYNICNLTQNRMNSMIGVYLVVMLMGSLGKKDSFLYGFFLHLFLGRRMGDPRNNQTITSLMGGSAFGYLCGTVMSLIGIRDCLTLACNIAAHGIIFLVIGLIVHRKRRSV